MWSDPMKALLTYFDQAANGDKSFFDRGLCRPGKRVNEPGRTVPDWCADFYDETPKGPRRADRALGQLAAEAALVVCANCPVQYDCAQYGVDTEARGVLHGVRQSSMEWLQRQPHNRALLASGRESGVSVEAHVLRLRGDR